MRSKTKYSISEKEIREIYLRAGFGALLEIAPMTEGEFNAVFAVKTAERDTVLKVAPPKDVEVLTYEKGMMATEIEVYRKMRNGGIPVPEVYYADDSLTVIPTPYFIMERIHGKPISYEEVQKKEVLESIGETVAKLHKIEGDGYGYLQMGLEKDWATAFCKMVQALIDDAKKHGRRTRRGEKLLREVVRFSDVLNRAECRLVNFDIWTLNLLVGENGDSKKPTWIDPERSFFGDPIADFVALEFLKPLSEKTATLEGYRRVTPLKIGREEEIRFHFYTAYLALIMEVEKYVRYTRFQGKWWANVSLSRLLYRKAFQGIRANLK